MTTEDALTLCKYIEKSGIPNGYHETVYSIKMQAYKGMRLSHKQGKLLESIYARATGHYNKLFSRMEKR